MKTEIKFENKLFALVFDLSSLSEGSFPVTDSSWPLQLLLMKRKKGHIVAKHIHKKIKKFSEQPQEAIVVIKGEIEASIFDGAGKLIDKANVSEGQCLLIVDGAHEVKIIKDALIYAFKDGPYIEDKEFLET